MVLRCVLGSALLSRVTVWRCWLACWCHGVWRYCLAAAGVWRHCLALRVTGWRLMASCFVSTLLSCVAVWRYVLLAGVCWRLALPSVVTCCWRLALLSGVTCCWLAFGGVLLCVYVAVLRCVGAPSACVAAWRLRYCLVFALLLGS